MKSAPAGVVETGAPSFVVLGPEALGLSSAPTDFKLLPDGRIVVVAPGAIAIGDGTRWNTFRASGESPAVFYSIAVDADGAIYTGSEGGISQIHLGADSKLSLKTVVPLSGIEDTQNATLVSVACLPEDWYWYGGNGAIVSWRPGRTPRTSGNMSGIDRIFTLGGEHFVSEEASGGLYRLGPDGTMAQLKPADLLMSAGISCATPYSQDRLLVGTGSSGLRLFDGTDFASFGDPGLIAHGLRITDLCPAGADYFAASIDSLGIVFFDRQGRLVQVLGSSLDHRLARARRLLYSEDGVLWALLNDGVARVQFPSPVSNFEPLLPGGLQFAQPLRHAGQLWMLANGRAMRGVYDSRGLLEQFQDDTPPGDFLFTLTECDGTLFGANDRGIFAFENGAWTLVLPGITNARVGVAAARDGGICYVARGEYGVIRRSGDTYVAERTRVPGLGDNYNAHIDSRGIGWIELGTSRIGRFDATGPQVRFETFGSDTGIEASGWIETYILDGVARFHVSGRLYRFDEELEKFVPDAALLAQLPQLAVATGRPATDNLGRIWYTLDGAMRVVDRSHPDGDRTVDVGPVGFAPTIYTAQDDGVVWIFERGRLARIDPRIPQAPGRPLKAMITLVQFSSSSRSVPEPAESLGAIDYADNSLVFHFAAPANPFGTPVTFEVLLEGSSERWVSTGAVGSAVFNRLKEDKYVFRVRPVRPGGIVGAEASVPFTILPPWYRTPAAWVAYSCIALALLGFVMWLSSYLQRRENERLEHLVAQRTVELSASNERLGHQIAETTRKSAALSASEERYRELNAELEDRVRERTAELEEAHRQLVAASRKAGMAEVATGVLHNVGNVLNSVNVSATLVRDTLRASEVGTLARVAGLIREHSADLAGYIANDPKGRHLPEFLMRLAEQLSKEHAVLSTENEQLARNVEHIKGIVAMQQGYATVSGIVEEVVPEDLVRDAFRMHAGSLDRHGIRFEIDAPRLPPVTLDKHKVLQILVNLVQNAKHAIREAGRDGGRIVARIALGDNDRMQLSIADNGIGIPVENLVRIFSHGFTTRTKGHGFGLHSGANAAREMGGALRVESAGENQGATFTLEIPIAIARAMA